MKKLCCEVCGGSDLLKKDGIFVCQDCGCKYTVEEVRKLMVSAPDEATGVADTAGPEPSAAPTGEEATAETATSESAAASIADEETAAAEALESTAASTAGEEATVAETEASESTAASTVDEEAVTAEAATSEPAADSTAATPEAAEIPQPEAPVAVSIDIPEQISKYFEIARTACISGNYTEAEQYSNRIIELDSKQSEAWLIKGKAAGWQSTLGNLRFAESIECWAKALDLCDPDRKESLKKEIGEELERLVKATVSTRANNFAGFPSDSNAATLCDTDSIFNPVLLLISKADAIVDFDSLMDYVAVTMNEAAIAGSDKADAQFGTDRSGRNRFAYTAWIGNYANCIRVLEVAATLATTEDTVSAAYQNAIILQENLISSCSYRFETSIYGPSGYVIDTSLSPEAKAGRKKEIENYRRKEQSRCSELREKRLSAEKEKQEEQAGRYWSEHPETKQELEQLKQEVSDYEKRLDDEYQQRKMADSPRLDYLKDRMNIKLDCERELDAQDNLVRETERARNNCSVLQSGEKKRLTELLDQVERPKLEQMRRWVDEERKKYKDSVNAEIRSIEADTNKLRDKRDAVSRVRAEIDLALIEKFDDAPAVISKAKEILAERDEKKPQSSVVSLSKDEGPANKAEAPVSEAEPPVIESETPSSEAAAPASQSAGPGKDIRDFASAREYKTLILFMKDDSVAVFSDSVKRGNIGDFNDYIFVSFNNRQQVVIDFSGSPNDVWGSDFELVSFMSFSYYSDMMLPNVSLAFGYGNDGCAYAYCDNECSLGNAGRLSKVSVGRHHVAAVLKDRTVFAAGDNSCGQCNVGMWNNIMDVSAGGKHTVAVRENGTVVATGSNTFGQCNVNNWGSICMISAGESHTVGVTEDLRTAVCTGSNERGQCNLNSFGNVTYNYVEAIDDYTLVDEASGKIWSTDGRYLGDKSFRRVF